MQIRAFHLNLSFVVTLASRVARFIGLVFCGSIDLAMSSVKMIGFWLSDDVLISLVAGALRFHRVSTLSAILGSDLRSRLPELE